MWLSIEDEGVIALERIVAVGQAESAPIRRLLDVVPASHIIVLTGGRKRQSAVILDSGHIILTAVPVAQIEFLLHQNSRQRVVNHHPLFSRPFSGTGYSPE